MSAKKKQRDDYLRMKKRLSNVAMHTFMIKGYHATTIEKIAENCDIKKPSVFHYFDSKVDIVLNIVNELNDYCEKNIFNIIHGQAQHAAQVFLDSACQFFIEKTEGQFIALLGNELVSIDKSLQQNIQTYFNNWRKAIQTIVTPFYETKQIASIINDSLAYIQGCLSLYYVSNKQKVYLQQLQQRLTELWLPR